MDCVKPAANSVTVWRSKATTVVEGSDLGPLVSGHETGTPPELVKNSREDPDCLLI